MFYIFLFFPCSLARYRNNAVLCFLHIFGADFLQQGVVPVLIAWKDGKCPDIVGIDIHLTGYLPEMFVKFTPGTVVVETQVMVCVGSDGKHPSDLGVCRSAAGGHEHAFIGQFRIVPECFPVYLIESHSVVCAFKPCHASGFFQRPFQIGYPQSFTRIASFRLALVTAASVHPGPSPFLEPDNPVRVLGQAERKSEVGVALAARTVPGRQTEVPVEGILCIQVDAPVLEEEIEFLLRRPVLGIELVDVVVVDAEGPDVPPGLDDPCIPVLDGMVQQAVAHEVHKPVAGYARTVFRKEVRMLLDKGDDVVQFLLGRLEAALAVGGDDELVTPDAPPVAVQPDIGRIAQAVPPVQPVACIDEHVLYGQAPQKIVVGQFIPVHKATSPYACR